MDMNLYNKKGRNKAVEPIHESYADLHHFVGSIVQWLLYYGEESIRDEYLTKHARNVKAKTYIEDRLRNCRKDILSGEETYYFDEKDPMMSFNQQLQGHRGLNPVPDPYKKFKFTQQHIYWKHGGHSTGKYLEG